MYITYTVYMHSQVLGWVPVDWVRDLQLKNAEKTTSHTVYTVHVYIYIIKPSCQVSKLRSVNMAESDTRKD